jgi:hypothetical protein
MELIARQRLSAHDKRLLMNYLGRGLARESVDFMPIKGGNDDT